MGNYISAHAFATPTPRALPQEAQFYKTRTGKTIPIVHYECPGAKYTVIFSHGSGSDVSRKDPLMREFCARLGVSAVSYEYIGYPHTRDAFNNPVGPSESGCYESIDAAFHYVTHTLRVPLHYQIWIGHSLGTGPTADLAARVGDRNGQLGGVVLVSPFKTAVSVASPFVALFYDMFETRDKVQRITSPLVIVHGSEDTLIPTAHSDCLVHKRKQNNQQTTFVVVNGATHYNMFAQPETWRAIATLLIRQ